MVSWWSGTNLVSITILGLTLNIAAIDLILDQGSSPLGYVFFNLVKSDTIQWRESVEIETFPRLNLFCLSKPRLQIFKINETKTAILDFSRLRLDKNYPDWENIAQLDIRYKFNYASRAALFTYLL